MLWPGDPLPEKTSKPALLLGEPHSDFGAGCHLQPARLHYSTVLRSSEVIVASAEVAVGVEYLPPSRGSVSFTVSRFWLCLLPVRRLSSHAALSSPLGGLPRYPGGHVGYCPPHAALSSSPGGCVRRDVENLPPSHGFVSFTVSRLWLRFRPVRRLSCLLCRRQRFEERLLM